MSRNKSNKISKLYFDFLKKYGRPRSFWQKWCCQKKTRQDREEIVLGAILTQRTNWRNVEMALANLKKAGCLSIKKVYQLGQKDIGLLEKLIRPSGFYRQKAKRLFELCQFINKQHQTLTNFFQQDTKTCRQQLLAISGIGPETADSILLYAGDKPVFVIDEYTRRLVKKYQLSRQLSYDRLQQLFQQSLPQNIKLYQDFHAMIVLASKGTDWDLVSKV